MKCELFSVISVVLIIIFPQDSIADTRECVEGDCGDGKGVLVFEVSDIECKYAGEFADDLFDGHGKLITETGNEYVGNFRKGKFYGLGTETDDIGVKYVGEFGDGKRHGHGTLTFSWAGQYKYVGYFNDGLKHGYGVEGLADGGSNIGYWVKGNYVGKDKPVDFE